MSKFKKSKPFVLVFLLIFALEVESEPLIPQSWDDPNAKFNATNTITNQTIVTWKRVDNVIEGCTAESKKLGVAVIKTPILACSFWTKTSCTIITGKTTTQHSLGHELRHCFQGDWHK